MIIIIICSLLNYFYITSRLSKTAVSIYQFNFDKLINKSILSYFSIDEDSKYNINDFIKLNYQNDEVKSISYDIEKTSLYLGEKIEKIENFFLYQNTSEIIIKNHFLIVNIPLGMLFNNTYFNSFGPKLPIKISFIDNYMINITTRVSNYGINNILVELYLVLNVKIKLLTKEDIIIEKKYEYLLSSVVINGKVPSINNGKYEVSSPNLNIQN